MCEGVELLAAKTETMKLYKRKDFIRLPQGTVYSKIDGDGEICDGLYCKVSGGDYGNDWIEQNLICEPGYHNEEIDGAMAVGRTLHLRDTFQDFRPDLYCAGRDGMFEDSDCFVVWDKRDVLNLVEYLQDCLKTMKL